MDEEAEEFEALFMRCQIALDQLRDASENSEHRSPDGRYGGISGRSALSAVGIRGDQAKEVRYYLRELGLAIAKEASQQATNLWYWEIAFEADVERRALKELVRKKPWRPRVRRNADADPNAQKIAELTARVALLGDQLRLYKDRFGELEL